MLNFDRSIGAFLAIALIFLIRSELDGVHAVPYLQLRLVIGSSPICDCVLLASTSAGDDSKIFKEPCPTCRAASALPRARTHPYSVLRFAKLQAAATSPESASAAPKSRSARAEAGSMRTASRNCSIGGCRRPWALHFVNAAIQFCTSVMG